MGCSHKWDIYGKMWWGLRNNLEENFTNPTFEKKKKKKKTTHETKNEGGKSPHL